MSLSLAAALVFLVLPLVVGTTFHEVGQALGAITGRDSVLLVALWAAGLLVYSFVLTGSLPGLTHRRALTLNLTGSAVSNVAPFGGAVGMSLNYVMMRSWRFTLAQFSSFTMVTNVWNVLLKLAMPPIALLALVVWGGPVNPTLRWSGLGAALALVLVVAGLAAGLASHRVARRLVRMLTPPLVAGARLVRRPVEPEVVAQGLMEFRDGVAEVVGRRWAQISLATIGYGLLQALLLWACLSAVGAHLAPVVVLAGYAVDRLMTMIVVTPGGAGFAEAGAAAALVALGGDPAMMAAGVLLYRGFTFALEIPVGTVWLAAWFLVRRRRAPAPPRTAGLTLPVEAQVEVGR